MNAVCHQCLSYSSVRLAPHCLCNRLVLVSALLSHRLNTSTQTQWVPRRNTAFKFGYIISITILYTSKCVMTSKSELVAGPVIWWSILHKLLWIQSLYHISLCSKCYCSNPVVNQLPQDTGLLRVCFLFSMSHHIYTITYAGGTIDVTAADLFYCTATSKGVSQCRNCSFLRGR